MSICPNYHIRGRGHTHDLVILEFISRKQIEELARARSNIVGEALHTRHRQEASAETSTMGLALTGITLRADTGCYLSPQ